MALLGTADLFGDGVGTSGAWYTTYQDYPYFGLTATQVAKLATSGQTILVVGCGWGFLVQRMLGLGFASAWGCDAAQYCVDRGKAVLGAAAAAHLLLGDILSSASMGTVRATALGAANRQFNLVLTECLLEYLSDAEIATALANCRSAGRTVAHLVSPTDTCAGDPIQGLGVNWKTRAQWKALIGATDHCLDWNTGAEF